MEKIKISLELNDRDAGYLLASVVEFHHSLRRASKQTPVPDNIEEKIQSVKKIWLEIEKQIDIL